MPDPAPPHPSLKGQPAVLWTDILGLDEAYKPDPDTLMEIAAACRAAAGADPENADLVRAAMVVSYHAGASTEALALASHDDAESLYVRGLVRALSPRGGESFDQGLVVRWNQETGEVKAIDPAREPDVKGGFPIIEQAANKGSVRAMIMMGYAAEGGYVDEIDNEAALRWYRKAADAGNAEGACKIGVLLADGLAIGDCDPADAYKESLAWYRKAADMGDAMAMHNLAVELDEGPEEGRDYEQAFTWYTRAYEAGYIDSAMNIGWMHRNGVGVEADADKAIDWYRIAAERGIASGWSNIGNMYLEGLGVEQDAAKAAGYYKQAALAGGYAGFFGLGLLFEEGRDGGPAKDDKIAYYWYLMAAISGLPEAAGNAKALDRLTWFGAAKKIRDDVEVWRTTGEILEKYLPGPEFDLGLPPPKPDIGGPAIRKALEVE